MKTYNHIQLDSRIPVQLFYKDRIYKLRCLIPSVELLESMEASYIYNYLSQKWADGIYLTFSYDDLVSFRHLSRMIPVIYFRNMIMGTAAINTFPYALFTNNQADPDSSLAEQIVGKDELNRRLTPGAVLR